MKRSILIVFFVLILSLAGCSRNLVDLSPLRRNVDLHLIKFNYIEYGIIFQPTPMSAGEHHLSLYDTIKRRDKNVYRNGDAEGLAAGTPVYTLDDYAPTFRLAVKQGQELLIYQVERNPKATKGSDVLDIGGKVERISIRDPNNYSEIASISDPVQIDDLVQMILKSPYNDAVLMNPGVRLVSLDFYLFDGTEINQFLWLDSGVMDSNIQLPEEFCMIIRDILIEQQGPS